MHDLLVAECMTARAINLDFFEIFQICRSLILLDLTSKFTWLFCFDMYNLRPPLVYLIETCILPPPVQSLNFNPYNPLLLLTPQSRLCLWFMNSIRIHTSTQPRTSYPNMLPIFSHHVRFDNDKNSIEMLVSMLMLIHYAHAKQCLHRFIGLENTRKFLF